MHQTSLEKFESIIGRNWEIRDCVILNSDDAIYTDDDTYRLLIIIYRIIKISLFTVWGI